MANANGYLSYTWVLQAAGIKEWLGSPGGASLLFGSEIDLGLLALITNTSVQDLEALRYPLVDQSEGGTLHRFDGKNIFKDIVLVRRGRVCPECLREKEYVRRSWELFPITVCPMHQVMLIDHCPSCRRRITWSKGRKITTCKCGIEWREIKSAPIEQEESGLSRMIHKACGFEIPKPGLEDMDEKNPLLSLTLDERIRAIVFIANHLWKRNHTSGMRMIKNLDILELHQFLSEAFRVFNSWPNSYFRFLEKIKGKCSTSRRMNNPSGIYNHYQPIYEGLYKVLNGDKFNFMRNAFEDYIKNNKDVGLIHSKYKLIHTDKLSDKKYLGKHEAASFLGIYHSCIDHFAKEGLLKVDFHRVGKRKYYMVEREGIDSLHVRLNDSMPIKEVEDYLGTNRRTIMNIIQKGFLSPILTPSIKGSKIYLIEKTQIDALLSRIAECVRMGRKVTKKDEVDVAIAAHVMALKGYDITELIGEILKGTIHPIKDNKNKKGLDRFRFDKLELYAFSKSMEENSKGNFLSTKDIKDILGINSDAIYELIKRGFIKSEKKGSVHSFGWHCSLKDINDFQDNYITLAELSKMHDCDFRYLKKLLDDINVFPVEVKDRNYCMPFLYKRKLIFTVDSNISRLIKERRQNASRS